MVICIGLLGARCGAKAGSSAPTSCQAIAGAGREGASMRQRACRAAALSMNVALNARARGLVWPKPERSKEGSESL